MWTQFWDMDSGGSSKEQQSQIYIEAPRDEAIVIFYNRFGHNPERVTCTCCGGDYSINEGADLAQLTAYHRGCKWIEGERGADGRYLEDGGGHYVEKQGDWRDSYQTLEAFKSDSDCLFIPAGEIKDNERHGEVPQEGYVWI